MKKNELAWFVWMLCLCAMAMPFFGYAIYAMITNMIETPTFNVIATHSLLLAFMLFIAVAIVALFVEEYKQIKSEK